MKKFVVQSYLKFRSKRETLERKARSKNARCSILRSIAPDILIYLCHAGNKYKKEQLPFMSVVFPQFREEVLPFLCEYGKELELELTQFPPHDPDDAPYMNKMLTEKRIVSNIWNVPFDLLAPFARVVMIDDPPIFQNNTMRTHYEYFDAIKADTARTNGDDEIATTEGNVLFYTRDKGDK